MGDSAEFVKAPKDNVRAGLTDEEAAEVVAWLLEQPELELNLTISEEAGEWDNSVSDAFIF